MVAPVLRIYGPVLEAVEVINDNIPVQYTNLDSQPKLAITLRGNSQIELGGVYDAVSVVGKDSGVAIVSRATVTNLAINGGTVQAGVVRTLAVRQPDACAAFEQDMGKHYVRVQAVSSGKLLYNDVEQPAKTINNSCGKVMVGRELDEYSEKGDY